MGQRVVHFEVVGKDAERLRSYYDELFGWEFDSVVAGPTDYATVEREANLTADDVGGGIGTAPDGYDGHVTFYVEVPDVEASLTKGRLADDRTRRGGRGPRDRLGQRSRGPRDRRRQDGAVAAT